MANVWIRKGTEEKLVPESSLPFWRGAGWTDFRKTVQASADGPTDMDLPPGSFRMEKDGAVCTCCDAHEEIFRASGWRRVGEPVAEVAVPTESTPGKPEDSKPEPATAEKSESIKKPAK